LKYWDRSKPWYHGSPFRLTVLRKGSTVTQDRDLARIFSYKPAMVSISGRTIKHDGTTPGLLYRVAEAICLEDLCPHPRSSMEEGKEWLTSRELRVELIGPTHIVEEEKLTEEELRELRKLAESRRGLGPNASV